MKIPVILNNEKIILSAEPSENLLTVLRREKFYSVKCGCEKGVCGNCMVLLNDKPVPSCSIPVGIIRDSRIITLEALKNDPVYQDIITGFNQAGLHLCGYCNAGKILTAWKILQDKQRPEINTIRNSIKGLALCCTDYDSLANGILYAVAAKHKREGKQNGKK